MTAPARQIQRAPARPFVRADGATGRASRLLAVLVALVACSAPPPGAPADAVVRLFTAVEAGDCDAALAALARAYRADFAQRHTCDELLADLRRLRLERVIDTRVDGRDARAHLVRIHLQGRATESWIRVEEEDGQWRIFSM